MPSIFIVRPFGTKSVIVNKDTSFDVDFELIDKDLIQSALKNNGLEGRTTGAIAEAGNIRLDMFQRLIAYDLVIADISIDNANVFYELGIRHGLRPKGTILIRFKIGKDVPFDLKTDRYIEYDREKPADAVDLLARSIKDTMQAMEAADQKPDSPVFLLLPELRAPDPARLVVVPREFQDAVEQAENDEENGIAKLALLSEEAKRTDWAREGVRLVARAQRRMGRPESFKAARRSWELLPNDIEANLQLATILQRLGEPVASSQACDRVLKNPLAERKHRADARSQLARNEKFCWVEDFRKIPDPKARREQAIGDSRLVDGFEGYLAGFGEDLNDYYSGINALGLATAIVKLAEMEPDAWISTFGSKGKAAAALGEHQEQLANLRGAVRMALDNARKDKKDEWLPPSEAQFRLLTSDMPSFVKGAYNAAKVAGGKKFPVGSEARQVQIFGALGIFPENCQAALEALGYQINPGVVELSTAELNKAEPPRTRERIIIATGHRIDDKGRDPPRFPDQEEHIEKARDWLRARIKDERNDAKGAVISAMAGAASGTDLIFHEVCAELGIKTTVVLPIPIDAYRRQSVAPGGPKWVEKFNDLVHNDPPIILSEREELPVWTASIAKYGVFQRGNIFLLQKAVLRPDADVTLLALWNEQAGDGPGGTADMVTLAEDQGAKIYKQNTNELFGLGK